LADQGNDLQSGDIVELLDHDGNWIARGLINPASRLRIRLYSFDRSVELGPVLWQQRIESAIARRRLGQYQPDDGAERLIFSESDLLSGLIVDRYADTLSIQFTSAGIMRFQEVILEHLQQTIQPKAMMIRVDEKTARYEGIEPVHQWYEGQRLDGPVLYRQNGLQLAVDLSEGQKTGGYLDQRLNHLAAAAYMKDRRLLDVCCYTGGFGLLAAKMGAESVLGIDSSQTALEEAQAAADRNRIENAQFRRSDCFDELKEMVAGGEQYDAVVLDPPRFAGSRHQIDRALRAYGRLNSHAVDLLPPGGVLVTCSCSGRVSRADFLNMLADVARRRRRDIVVLESHGPAPDHPVSISCPESDYLKCVIAEVR